MKAIVITFEGNNTARNEANIVAQIGIALANTGVLTSDPKFNFLYESDIAKALAAPCMATVPIKKENEDKKIIADFCKKLQSFIGISNNTSVPDFNREVLTILLTTDLQSHPAIPLIISLKGNDSVLRSILREYGYNTLPPLLSSIKELIKL